MQCWIIVRGHQDKPHHNMKPTVNTDRYVIDRPLHSTTRYFNRNYYLTTQP